MDNSEGCVSVQNRVGGRGRGRGRNQYQDQRQPLGLKERVNAHLDSRLNDLEANHCDNSNGQQPPRNQEDELDCNNNESAMARARRRLPVSVTTSTETAEPKSKINLPDAQSKDDLRLPQSPNHVCAITTAESLSSSVSSLMTESGGAAAAITSMETMFKVDRLEKYLAEEEEKVERRMMEELLERMRRRKSLEPLPLVVPDNVNEAIIKQKQALPIYAVKEELIDVIRRNQIVIVTGSTGSGKSTQIPQYIAEAGLHGNGRIAVTQTRRIAAKLLATRVAAECGVEVGTTVGYRVKLDSNCSNEQTVITFFTDGIFLRECARDTILAKFSVVIIDEAHERSINTDVILGFLKGLAGKRPDLRIIISSATLDEDKFSRFFNHAPVFRIGGTLHPVEIIYQQPDAYKVLNKVVDTIFEINQNNKDGDILVFLAGQAEIEKVQDKILKRMRCGTGTYILQIIQCYGAQSFKDQQKIYDAPLENHRKVVLATNIAETSLTIDGIKYVIDSGFFKEWNYDPKSGISSVVCRPITKFQATQRLGRAGRTQPGICYRLYEKEDLLRLQDAPKPEIRRSNLESVILDILSMGFRDPFEFPFLDPPSEDSIFEALEHLRELDALNASLQLRGFGRRLSEFPTTPRLAKVILESERLGCEQEVLKIVGMLSIPYHNLFKVKRGNQTEEGYRHLKADAEETKKKFKNADGDLLTLLKIYDTWVWNGLSHQWCLTNYIQSRLLHEAMEIRKELEDVLRNRSITKRVTDKTGLIPKKDPPVNPDESGVKSESIRKAFTAGYFRQIAIGNILRSKTFETVGNIPYVEDVFLRDSSSLVCRSKERYVIYHEASSGRDWKGKKMDTFMCGAIEIKPSWVSEYAPEVARKIRRWAACRQDFWNKILESRNYVASFVEDAED